MANISLSSEELSVVRHALETYLAELHDEVHHTDNRDMKDQLKQEEQTIQKVIRQMDGAE